MNDKNDIANNNNELEQLRSQMSIFKSKLDKQEIINEQLVRNTMTHKLSWIKKFVWGEIILVPILLAFFAVVHHLEGYSWWLFAYMAMLLIADVVGDYRINNISKGRLMSDDLVETCRRLTKMKKYRIGWFIAGAIFTTIWLVWFCIETVLLLNDSCSTPDHNIVVTIIVGSIVVGGIIGITIAWLITHKMQRTNSQLIEQLNQIISTEPNEAL